MDTLERLKEKTAYEPGMRQWTGRFSAKVNPEVLDFLESHPAVMQSMTTVALREALGADVFDSITLDKMHKSLLKGYKSWDQQWPKIVSSQRAINDFRTQYAILRGSFDRLSEIKPSGKYLEVEFADDQITYTPAKYGAMFAYTFEAQTYDDLGLLETKAQMLGDAAARTIDYFVFYTSLDANPTSYDGSNNIFSSAFSNTLSTAGLNYDRLKEAYEKMLQQTDIDSNNVVFIPRYLIVHPAQALRARELVESQFNPDSGDRTKNPMANALEIIVTPYITSTNWYLAADPKQANTFEIGLWKGSATPELFYEPTNTGHAFDFDEIRTKVRLIFGGALLDPRSFVKGTTA